MNKTPFQRFIDLVALDQDILALHKECDNVSLLLTQTAQAKQAIYDHMALLKQQLQQARKAVDSSELEMKVLDEQEKNNKKRLDTITNLREYNSVKAELDAIHEAQELKEQQVLQVWHKLDSAQQEYDAYEKELEEKIRVHDQEAQSYTEKHATCIQQVEELERGRSSKQEGIPEEWLEKYMIMQSRVADPVVPLHDDTCSACFHEATKQDALVIQRGALVQCKGCYRLLYAPQKGAHE